jgi:hypothetical protein
MDFQKQREQYVEAAKEHLHNYGVSDYSDHIVDIIVSVMFTRDGVMQGGHFAQAICNNDLRGALSRADDDCTKHLRVIALAHPFAFIQN